MENFRRFTTTSGKLVLAGKSAETNEELIEQIKENEIVLHTKNPGSPFTNIKADEKELSKKDIKESAIFCAKYSQDWRDNKQDVTVHCFKAKDIYKEKNMKKGTFGVRNFKEIKIKKSEIKNFENETSKETADR